jgi:Leucine-rich repeat (LRR) protein
VNGTNLEGVIRDSFEPFQSLRFADFSKNAFTGPLPASIFDSTVIEILYFPDNALTGSIPANYGNASSLHDLYLNDNKLIGMVPPIGPGQLSKLTEFQLQNNAITGTMPASICALRGEDRANDLVALIADCGGLQPLIQCDCCNGCA